MKQNVQFCSAADGVRLACAMNAEGRRAQSIAAHRPGMIALVVNTGPGVLRLRHHGRTARLAVGDGTLCDTGEPFEFSGEPNQISRVLCIQVPRERVQPQFDRCADAAAVTIPAQSPALVLARIYMEGLLSGGLGDERAARLAADHLADLVAVALGGQTGEIAPGPRPRPAAEDGADGKREEALSALSAATLAVMPTPVIILDAKGHCLDTNAAADRLLAATGLIRISGGVLVIADQDAQRQVADAIEAAAVAADAPGARALVALMLEGRRLYAAEVIPLLRGARRRIRAVAALLLQEIGNLRPLPSEILAKLYGLTPAEARLVALLAQDFSLEHAAAVLGIARTTAKTHLQHVFEKTGTNRQPQVVRLALSAISAPAS